MSDRPIRSPLSLALLGALLLSVAGCGDGKSSSSGSNFAPGTIADNPGINDGFTKFVVDSNKNGNASELKIVATLWGRLVDIYEQGPGAAGRSPLFRDFLIGEDITTDGTNYVLERSPSRVATS